MRNTDLSAIPRNERGIEVQDIRNGVFFSPNEGHCCLIAFTDSGHGWDRWWSTVRDLMLSGN